MSQGTLPRKACRCEARNKLKIDPDEEGKQFKQ